MEDITEAITIQDYNESDYFNKMKADIWEHASNDKEINLSALPPHEYKYFSELYWLYNDLHHQKISQQEAEKQDKKNYNEYVEYANAQIDYIHARIIINENIRKAGTLLSDIEKSSDVKEIALLACEAIQAMTGDTSFLKRQKKKIEEK